MTALLGYAVIAEAQKTDEEQARLRTSDSTLRLKEVGLPGIALNLRLLDVLCTTVHVTGIEASCFWRYSQKPIYLAFVQRQGSNINRNVNSSVGNLLRLRSVSSKHMST